MREIQEMPRAGVPMKKTPSSSSSTSLWLSLLLVLAATAVVWGSYHPRDATATAAAAAAAATAVEPLSQEQDRLTDHVAQLLMDSVRVNHTAIVKRYWWEHMRHSQNQQQNHQNDRISSPYILVNPYRNENEYYNDDRSKVSQREQSRQEHQSRRQRQRQRALLNAQQDNNVYPSPRYRNGTNRYYEGCDAAFVDCSEDDACSKCYLEMQSNDVNWALVTIDTTCNDVLQILYSIGHCSYIQGVVDAEDVFCATYDNCIFFNIHQETTDTDTTDTGSSNSTNSTGNNNGTNAADEETVLDCDALTECKWPGMHPQFIGDGVCHDGMVGCYNTAICNWDGGDCCEDTCKSKGNYNTCGGGAGGGQEGYQCRDPDSPNCDPWLSFFCRNNNNNNNNNNNRDDDFLNPYDRDCPADSTVYRLIMYDSFGDGWGSAKLELTPQQGQGGASSSDPPLFSGGLASGSHGTQWICLSKSPTCYHVQVTGGVWGNEVSWEIKPYTVGAPAIAGGGALQTCSFPVSGALSCNDTVCDGKRVNVKPADDVKYTGLTQELSKCITEKCPIQVGTCQKDHVCKRCFSNETTADFCYGIDMFNALVDCSMCTCTEKKDSSFCNTKLNPGAIVPNDNNNNNKNNEQRCSPVETVKGGNAVLEFGTCTNLDELKMIVTEFSQDNFGALDTFEACAHSFRNDDNHGGHTARSCLRVLVDAMNQGNNNTLPDEDEEPSDLPVNAIAALAYNLYHNASSFCACAKDASDNCPLCPSFHNFKTLLYESLDACQALDDIDCDAWEEFYRPCKNNIINQYKLVDFTKAEQCKYVHDGCGDAGPFPAFRKLDCDAELPKAAWDFYMDYAGACLKDNVEPPAPAPQPAPEPVPATNAPITIRPVAPLPPPPDSKPIRKYVPPEERYKTSKSSQEGRHDGNNGSSSHWFRNVCLVGLIGGAVCYVVIKRRADDGFRFIRFPRHRGNYAVVEDDSTGLMMETPTISVVSGEPSSPPTTPI